MIAMNAKTNYMRATYHETENYRVYVELINEQPFVHVAIFNATKEVVEEIKEIWAQVVLDVYFEGYECLFAYTKDNRIVNMIGGAEKIGEHSGYEVWKWDLS